MPPEQKPAEPQVQQPSQTDHTTGGGQQTQQTSPPPEPVPTNNTGTRDTGPGRNTR